MVAFHVIMTEMNTNPASSNQSARLRWILIGGGILFLVLSGLAIYALLQPSTPTERIRDIFIIILALESLVIGAALIVLLIQMAILINLLQNEVRPILQATQDTVNNLRGTAQFLGENVVEPVLRLNSYLAGIQRVIQLIGIKQKF
jgi:hypothetical protein